MATVEKEIAEENLDNCQRELQETRDLLAEATSQIEALQAVKDLDDSTTTTHSTVTVYQLQKVEEQNEMLKQALGRLRDISARDRKALDELQIEHTDLLETCLDLESKEQRYLDQMKIFEEQIDVSSSAQEMVEKLGQEKAELEDKVRELRDDLEGLEKLRDINEQILENARDNEIELTGENDRLRVQFAECLKAKKSLEDYMSEQSRTLGKLSESNRQLQQQDQVAALRGQFDQSESLEQQKHQIENVAYKLNFSESKMAEKEAEIARYKRNLASMEEQMNSLSQLTKAQAQQLDELRVNYDSKMGELSELKGLLKKKMEEVSELEIRKDMVEKKLSGLQCETESKLAALNKKIEEMKGREVEYEEALKRQEEDIDSMEIERRELREQLTRSTRTQLERQHSLQTSQ